MKKTNFCKIWMAIALPILAITMIALAQVLGLLMMALIFSEELRASEAAYETALALQNENLDSFEQNCERLNLEKYRMVAVLYNGQGEVLGESDAVHYEDMNIPTENYCLALEKLKKMQFNEQRGNPGFDGTDIFGISYLYGRERFMADGEIYTMRYGALIFPWGRHGRLCITVGLAIIFGVLAVTFCIAGYYHRIYKERLRAEEYYRNTSNALAHDLKTPLMAISGYAEMLQENVHTEKRNYYAEGILKHIAVMNGLIENMLELARLENPKTILMKESINLYGLTEQILEQYQAEIQLKEIQVSVQGRADIWADRPLMKRALENLIGNAVKYTPEKNKITITIDEKQYQIKNTGVMIPEEELPHIWEPFVKGDSARTNTAGTGIGLTIVREILERHSFGYKIGNEENGVSVVIFYSGKSNAPQK